MPRFATTALLGQDAAAFSPVIANVCGLVRLQAFWGSTLAVDGRIYLPTAKHLWVLAAGREKRVLKQISLGAPVWATPVVADGVLYVASKNYLCAVKQ